MDKTFIIRSQTMASVSKKTFLKDYKASDYSCEHLDISFELDAKSSNVHAKLQIKRQKHAKADAKLVLHGEQLQLKHLAIDDKELRPDQYQLSAETLVITNLPEHCCLDIRVSINPAENKALSGLYQSGNTLCTQCEAEGFRRIMYYFDRPDVLSTMTCTLIANQDLYPTLLSNGNRLEAASLEDNRHWVKWHDPHPKPSYLFALVAGDFDQLSDQFNSAEDKAVDLHIYAPKGKQKEIVFAMSAIKRAMKWDEDHYGRYYDLDAFHVVAIDDFNAGAMENKGLNIFNSQLILGSKQTATDAQLSRIENVIGHEYFHNWSGNRVTLRDWFQLSLKEGLTVFRDQSFSADMQGALSQRIADVAMLRARQFAEDQSPLAHPVQPKSFVSIDNFYTSTVYEKGAEVLRMFALLLGKKTYRQVMDAYFSRFDGKAVTIEDLLGVASELSDLDTTIFRRWYDQAGTPVLKVSDAFDEKNQTYTLSIEQSYPASSDASEKKPVMIPFDMGFVSSSGKKLEASFNQAEKTDQWLLTLDQAKQTFVFDQLSEKPIPSLARHFSAPIHIDYDYDSEALLTLMRHDSDPFNRWEAGQRLYKMAILDQINQGEVDPDCFDDHPCLQILNDISAEGNQAGIMTKMLCLPSISEMLPMAKGKFNLLLQAHQTLQQSLADQGKSTWLDCYEQLSKENHQDFDPISIGKRQLKGLSLSYLVKADMQLGESLSEKQFTASQSMNDTMQSLSVLSLIDSEVFDHLLNAFFETWQADPAVLVKWFSVQACGSRSDTLSRVERLIEHESFHLDNPNCVYALIGGLSANIKHFHDPSENGYRLIARQIMLLDRINTHVSSRMLRAFAKWPLLDEMRQNMMKNQLKIIQKQDGLSKQSSEIIDQMLA
jgi:aminopeptidase N